MDTVLRVTRAEHLVVPDDGMPGAYPPAPSPGQRDGPSGTEADREHPEGRPVRPAASSEGRTVAWRFRSGAQDSSRMGSRQF